MSSQQEDRPIIFVKKLFDDASLPEKQTNGASGFDLRAFLPDQSIILKPLERILIPTGLSLEIPPSFEGQVRARSGLALKYGLSVLNAPGTIDSDYRGEIKVLLINLSNEIFEITHQMRIAQIVFARVAQPELTEIELLTDSVRGEKGFGHTGIQ